MSSLRKAIAERLGAAWPDLRDDPVYLDQLAAQAEIAISNHDHAEAVRLRAELEAKGAELKPERQTPRTHGPDGAFVADPETARRDARAAELRGQGKSYRAIAAELDISVSTAHEAVDRALKAIRAEGAAEARQLELERLDATLERLAVLQSRVEAVLAREHITVQQGKVIYHGDVPLLDTAPILAAVDRLIKIESERRAVSESRRKLLGLDAEQKASIAAEITYHIVGISEGDL